ncbi:MAG: mechanosensitive ion channel [Deltaproteobacteria bacterium]|nr:mechanosensitive ion channel [Deltaproteobacteria bacterium]
MNIIEWPIIETLILLAVSGTVAWFLQWGWTRFLRFAWSSGLDPRYRLAHTVAPFRLLVGLAVVGIALAPYRPSGSPEGVAIFIGLLALAVMVGFNYFRDIVGGVALSLRRPFTLHDQIATATISGRVVDIGLTRVRIRTPDGGLADLPNRELSGDRIRTSGAHGHALPIEVRVPVRAGQNVRRFAAALNDQVFLSCFVDAGAPIIVDVETEAEIIVRATPTHPDDADELRSDIAARAALALHKT